MLRRHRHEVVLLAHPGAGRGRGARASRAATDRLRAAGVTVRAVVGQDAADALDRTRAELAQGADALVVVGGDGTVNLGVRALCSGPSGTGGSAQPVPLGIVPGGTGNDSARSLGLPGGARPADVDAAVDRILAGLAGGPRRVIDVAWCQGRPFLTVLAAGFDAIVNERANAMTWPRGQARYTLATLLELRTLAPRTYVLELDGVAHTREATVVAVGNGPSFGGGLRVTEGAELDDGLLDVVVFGAVGRSDLLRTYPRLFTGTHTTHPAYERHRVRRVSLAAPGIVAYADGERLGPLPISVEVEPAGLEVLA